MGAGLAYALACDRRFADGTARLCAAMVRLGARRACHALDVVGITQESAYAVLDDLRQPADARCDDGHYACHRFERTSTSNAL